MPERLRPIGPEASAEKVRQLNMKICVWCTNRESESCITECQQEGKYRHLDPEPLEEWEPGPRLPQFRDMLQMTPYERLAILWLAIFYQGHGR